MILSFDREPETVARNIFKLDCDSRGPSNSDLLQAFALSNPDLDRSFAARFVSVTGR